LTIEDFHEKDPKNHPQLTIYYKIPDPENVHINKELWVDSLSIATERWTWFEPGKPPLRVGYRVDRKDWANENEKPQAPFGPDSNAASYRPSITYISPFEQTGTQLDEIKKIIAEEIYGSIKENKKQDPKYDALMSQIKDLQIEVRKEAKESEEKVQAELGAMLNELFYGTKIDLSIPQNDIDLLASYAIAKEIDFKINELPFENQGSGMQRIMLWSVLKYLSNKKKNKNKKIVKSSSEKPGEVRDRARVLLMDEPEICLHPESIRQAKEILYNLALSGEWQIIITSHSPIFIDLSKNNTNIIRIHKDDKEVRIFKAVEANLSDDDKEKLKMLNIFDSYFAEFFFAKNVIVVEGDTEYTAFKKIIDANKSKYKDIHIIRARGKYTIIPIIKILLKWGKGFTILHDSDDPNNKQSWPANESILNAINSNQNIKLLACKGNFENAFFDGRTYTKDKPFNAYKELDIDQVSLRVESVLEFLSGIKKQLSTEDNKYVCEYKSIKELIDFINS